MLLSTEHEKETHVFFSIITTIESFKMFHCDFIVQVVLGILCFPVLLCLEFKSKEEMQLMPQTVEEHMQGIQDSDSEVSSTHPDLQDLQVCTGVIYR